MEPTNSASTPTPTVEPEQTTLVAYKHLFGLFIIYAQVIVGLVASLLLIYLLLPSVFQTTVDGNKGQAHSIIVALGFIVIILAVVILFLATIVYRGNKLVLSNKNLRQFSQTGLFHTSESQLNLANIEDVTAKKQGFFASVFNYGLVTVETAGEQDNFLFHYCPNAGYFAQAVLEARADYVAKHPGEAS